MVEFFLKARVAEGLSKYSVHCFLNSFCQCLMTAGIGISLFGSAVTGHAGNRIANQPPRIIEFNAVRFRGVVYLWGRVSDPDSTTAFRSVSVWGAVNSRFFTNVDGVFGVKLEGVAPYGVVYARTSDAQGNLSNIAIGEFFE